MSDTMQEVMQRFHDLKQFTQLVKENKRYLLHSDIMFLHTELMKDDLTYKELYDCAKSRIEMNKIARRNYSPQM